jgi:hypothetical protein
MSQGALLIDGAWIQGQGTALVKPTLLTISKFGQVMKLMLLMLSSM